MKNIEIEINGEKFSFGSEILMRHLRKIEPLSEKMEVGEIGKLDFFVEIALVLCNSDNEENLENTLDNLDFNGVEKFTKDFEPILKVLNNFNQKQIEDKKK